MKKIVFFFLIILFSSFISAEIRINEIMYNPSGNDNNREFIEIFSDEKINLSGYFIEDSSSDDKLVPLFYYDGHYSLIVEEGFNYSGIDASIYSTGATIGNNLNNDWDLVILNDGLGNIIDAVSYSVFWGADGNNNSLCRIPDKSGVWQECSPTPGIGNIDDSEHIAYVDYVVDGDTLTLMSGEKVRLVGIDTPELGEYYYTEAKNRLKELVEGKQITLGADAEDKDMYGRLLRYVYLNDIFVNLLLVEEGLAKAYPYPPNTKYESLFSDAEKEAQNSELGIWSDSRSYTSFYNSLEINEFFPDPEGYDNSPMPDGEFIELYNIGDNDTDLSGLYFMDSANHRIYITDTTTIDGTIIKGRDYLAVYMNGFSGFLDNEDFEEIGLYDPDGNLIDHVDYADSKEALSWSLVDDVWQYRLPTPNERNAEYEPEMESSFKIEKLEDIGSDNEAEFGDIIKVKFYVYKGDTTKSSIKLYIEDDEDRISKITKATLHDKFTNYSLTLPIQLYPNCDEKFDDGIYDVKLGWTSSSESEDLFGIKVKGINMDNCDKIYVEKQPKKGTLKYSLLECPGTVEITEEFAVEVELTNDDDQDHLVDLYSYVYRGPKCYSVDKESNKKTILVKAGQTKEVELKNLVTEAEPGDYKLKVKIKRDDQKTEKEITHDIKLLAAPAEIKSESLSYGLEAAEQEETEIAEDSLIENLGFISELKLKTVYESTNFKTKKIIPYFIIVFLSMFTLFLIFNKKFD